MQRAAVDALPLNTRLKTLGLMGRWGGDVIEDRLYTKYTKELQDWSNLSRASTKTAERLLELYSGDSLFSDIAKGYQLAAHTYSAVKAGPYHQ